MKKTSENKSREYDGKCNIADLPNRKENLFRVVYELGTGRKRRRSILSYEKDKLVTQATCHRENGNHKKK